MHIMPDRDINKFKLFFEKDERMRKQEPFNLCEAFNLSMSDLYNNFKNKIFTDLLSIDQHRFLKEVENQSTKGSTLEKSEMKTCDQIFASYIIEFHPQTNREYFIFISKFVTLFRECINVYRKIQDSNEEFTTKDGADTVPDLCNEFITEFMETQDNFNLDQNEVIELIQHFCYWLYENKFTTSRLTLLG
jgi:hypothetical protein